jgi:clathrin heavy chain
MMTTAAGQLQVFNLDTKQRVKAHTISDPVQYWRWVDASTIALVSATAVYHWSAEGSDSPVKLFDRDSKLEGSQIIGYRYSPCALHIVCNWCVITVLCSM